MSTRQWIHRHYLLFRRTFAWLMIAVMMITNVSANVDGYETARLSVKPYETEEVGMDPAEIDAIRANASVSVHETNLVGIAIDDGESETVKDETSDVTTYALTTSEPESASGDATTGTADHIDIEVNVTASLTIGEKTLETTVTLTEDDIKNGNFTVTAMQGDSEFTDFTVKTDDLETSTGADGVSQIRIGGSYPVGTKDNPVYYTVKLTKEIEFVDEDAGTTYTIIMTFTSTFYYWESDNNCPGLYTNENDFRKWEDGSFIDGSGLDFKLGDGSDSEDEDSGYISIQKTVTDEDGNILTLTEEQTYEFAVYRWDEESNEWTYIETVLVTVGSSGIGLSKTDLEPGTYYVVETKPEETIATSSDAATLVFDSLSYGLASASDSMASGTVTVETGETITISATNIYRPLDTPDTSGGGGGAGGTDATGSFTPTFVKYITGRSFRSTDTFTFALVKTAPDGTVTTESVTITPEAGAYSYSGTFGTDTFTEDDIGLTYTYVISEEEGDISRMTYDTTEYTVEVTITDDGDDDLTVTALLDDGTEFDTAEFTNRYYSSSSGGGGGSSGGGSSSSSSSTASTSGGPGTTSGSSSDDSSGSGSGDPASPSDADPFLGALPKTGVDSSNGVLFILTGMTLVAYVLINRRREKEE